MYKDLIYIGSRKRQALLSKLGAWGSWKRTEREWGGREDSSEKIYSSIKTILKKNKKQIHTIFNTNPKHPVELTRLLVTADNHESSLCGRDPGVAVFLSRVTETEE